MTKKKHFENCGRTDGRKDLRTTDATPWHKLIGSFGPDELKMALNAFCDKTLHMHNSNQTPGNNFLTGGADKQKQ